MSKKEKLVRDLIPQIMKTQGKAVDVYAASYEQYFFFLKQKLVEEVDEFLSSERIEELADVLEVVESLAQAQGYNWENLMEAKNSKKMERGGFSQRLILKS